MPLWNDKQTHKLTNFAAENTAEYRKLYKYVSKQTQKTFEIFYVVKYDTLF